MHDAETSYDIWGIAFGPNQPTSSQPFNHGYADIKLALDDNALRGFGSRFLVIRGSQTTSSAPYSIERAINFRKEKQKMLTFFIMESF